MEVQKDIVQAAQNGLVAAAQNYDATQNTFSTYASVQIRIHIRRALAEAYGITLPHFNQWRTAIKRAKEIREKTGKSSVTAEELKKVKVSEAGINLFLFPPSRNISLHDSPSSVPPDFTYEDIIVDPDSVVEDILEEEHSIKEFLKLLYTHRKVFSQEEYLIITAYFETDKEGEGKTTAQIAKYYEMSEESVRKVKGEAIKKIRANPELNEYLTKLIQQGSSS